MEIDRVSTPPPTSVSHGVLLSLRDKLKKLSSEEGLSTIERKKIDDLIVALPSTEQPEASAPVASGYWVREVRDLSYDIDDFVDQLSHTVAEQRNLRGKTSLKSLSRLQWVLREVSQFRARLEEAIQWCRPRAVAADEQGVLPPDPLVHGRSSHALFASKAPCLIDMESSMNKIGGWLTDQGDHQLKVISIVGPGGVGKTTLAKQLYGKIGKLFNCRAFVRSSQKPDMKRLLTSILLQVRPDRPPDAFESSNLINTIKAHLLHNKYLIIIDDIWSSSTWDIVYHALPDDNICSRILVTTELDTVAQRCCGHNSKHTFEMKPLGDDESRALFLSRVTGRKCESSDELNKVLDEVITKCDGFPLAINAISGLFTRQHDSSVDWNNIWNSIRFSFDGIQQLLHLCYNDLPDHLKACMLYLSMYREDYIIWKDDLVKQWIAEGFICEEERKDMLEVAYAYFYELIDRGMIQPVDMKYNGEVLSCSVHYMILLLIRYDMAIEKYLVTAVDPSETIISPAHKVRRLSLQFGDAEDVEPPANLELSKVRSLVFFGVFKCLPTIKEYGLLRVLILHLWSDQDNISLDLTAICKLFRLRYLEISCNVTLGLQSQLKGLQYLETLKLDSRVTELPAAIIVDLPCLLHLSLPGDTKLPNGIGKMTSLQTLECFDLSRNSPDNVLSLGDLENLWDLRLTCPTVPGDDLEKNMISMAKIVPKFKCLTSLTLLPAPRSSSRNTQEASSSSSNSISSEGLREVSSFPETLERLELSPRICIFSCLPKAINQELSKLSILKVAVWELCQNDVNTLAQLPALTSLALYVRALAKRVVFPKDSFPVLEHFKLISTAPRIEIVEGAMPNVCKLKLGFSANTTDESSLKCCGFEHLTALEEIYAKVESACTNAAESELQATFSPRKVNIQWVQSIFSGDQGNIIAASKGGNQIKEKPNVAKEGSDEQHGSGEEGSTEDSRNTVSTESSSLMQTPGAKSLRPAHGDVPGEAKRIIKYMTRKLLLLEGLHVKTDIASLSLERQQMSITIEESSRNSPGHLPERQIVQLQDLVYDIEDFVDIYYNNMRIISSKATSKSKRIRWRAHALAHLSHIMSLQHRIRSLQKWQQRSISSHGGGTASSSTSPGFNPYAPLRKDELVGMDEPLRELQELLLVSDKQAEPLTVISIVGCRGVGKTTLAASVFHDHHVWEQFQFELRAWVVASKCNSAEDFLKSIIQQVYGQSYMQETLPNRRCLIVIDDLQQEQARMWHEIQNTLAGARPGSRIIVTTSIQSVAAECSPEKYIYRMGVLDRSASTRLFWGKVDKRVNRSPYLDSALEDTLIRKCDSLPLALVGAASYLRAKGQNLHQLELGGPVAFEAVNRVLMQCYDSLPDYGHRACLLYLSIFPEGHYIKRKSVIRAWISEGLVKEDSAHGRSAEQVGGDRFDELVDRNLIEPVLIANNSKVKRCRFSSVMLEFINNQAVSKAFVTLIRKNKLLHNNEDAYPVRRLSVHGSTAECGPLAAANKLTNVRSLMICHGEPFGFLRCRLVRLLDLEGSKRIDEWTLGCICKLSLLKYLSLRGSDVGCIPEEIKELECLQTLDLRETEVSILPMEVITLPQLVHLFGRFKLPGEVDNKKEASKLEATLSEKSVLQTLSGFIMDNNSACELILLHTSSLRKVKIWSEHSISTNSEDRLAYSLRKSFSKDNGLESLSIDFGGQSINFLGSVLLEGPCMLSSIKLRGRLSRLPNFITLLDNLSELQLSFTCLSLEDLSVLQRFRQLLYLKLVEGPCAFWGGRFVVQKGGFPSLLRLCFEAPKLPEVRIDEGGMCSLAFLHLLCPEVAFCSQFTGIQHLKYLNEVVLHRDVGDEELDDWKNEAKGHENRPKVFRHGGLFGIKR